jgi:hypothetical protein
MLENFIDNSPRTWKKDTIKLILLMHGKQWGKVMQKRPFWCVLVNKTKNEGQLEDYLFFSNYVKIKKKINKYFLKNMGKKISFKKNIDIAE